jgi:hypothetical protein
MVRLAAVLAVAAAFAGAPAAASADGMIQGTWMGDLGTIEITPTGPGTWVGTVTDQAGASCAYSAGRQVWRIDARTGPRTYAGTHAWVHFLTCEPGGEAPASYTLRYADEKDADVRPGVPELEVCLTNPIDVVKRSCFVFHQPVDALVVRDRDGCSRLRQGQWHIARFEAHRLELHSNSQVPAGFPPIEISRRELDFPLGRVRIGAATCRKRDGDWGIISPVAVHVESVGLNDDGKPRKRGKQPELSEGWAIGVKALARGSLEVQVEQCKEGRFWATMQHLNDVPIPAIKYGWDLAKYVGGKFLPEDDVDCVDYGVQELELRVGRSGRLGVRPGYDETVDQVVTTPSADGTTYLWQTTVSAPEVVSVSR